MAVYVFGCYEVGIVCFANLVDCDDIRVIEGGCRASFALEAAHPLGVFCEFGGQHLQCDLAAKSRVFGEVYFSHAAGAQ